MFIIDLYCECANYNVSYNVSEIGVSGSPHRGGKSMTPPLIKSSKILIQISVNFMHKMLSECRKCRSRESYDHSQESKLSSILCDQALQLCIHNSIIRSI